jgi:hypothetical protein
MPTLLLGMKGSLQYPKVVEYVVNRNADINLV